MEVRVPRGLAVVKEVGAWRCSYSNETAGRAAARVFRTAFGCPGPCCQLTTGLGATADDGLCAWIFRSVHGAKKDQSPSALVRLK